MLKEMDIFVRSHLSPLRPEQVALMRARWERDKRKQKQPAALPKRRRAAKVVEPVAPVAEAPPHRRHRHPAPVAAPPAVEPRDAGPPWPRPGPRSGDDTIVLPSRPEHLFPPPLFQRH